MDLIVKKLENGKIRRYRNLATFNEECPSRGIRGNLCMVTNVRHLKRGGIVATIDSVQGPIKGRPSGTWRVQFADAGVFKRHMKARAIASPKNAAAQKALAGARRTTKRRRK